MTPASPPRTLLEALVRQRRWSQREFCEFYADAARELGLNLTVSPQHVGRWFGGRLKGLPYPSQCRVLESMFGVGVAALLAPPATDLADPAGGPMPRDPEEDISMAAEEAARFAQFAEQSNVGPHTLEQFAADIRRIVTVYPNRPVYPLFVELRALRARAFEALEGRQPPAQTRDLYLVAGVLSGLLANASFDLGRADAAETQARTGFLCAELAGSNWLRAWVRGLQALVAYWDDRPIAAVRLAEDGQRYEPESGTAAVRLACIVARAQGQLRDHRAVADSLAFAQDARVRVIAGDEPGGMMAFPHPKQLFYAATAQLWLGDTTSARAARSDAAAAVDLYEQAPAEERRLGELNLARLDLATSHLALDQLDAMTVDVQAVIHTHRARPTSSVVNRLRQVDAALARPRYRGNADVAGLRDQIAVVVGAGARPALPPGQAQ